MWQALIAPIMGIIDKIIPDPVAREAAKLELVKTENQQVLQEASVQLSAILAEAQSSDPWTSRARPMFMYVIYALIMAAIPMGIIHALAPEHAAQITVGFKAWLAAIPEPMLTLFGVGYLGYTGARTFDKWKTSK